MRRRAPQLLLTSAAVLIMSAGCGDGRTPRGDAGGALGAECTGSSDCASGICIVASGRCTMPCSSDLSCPSDWRCGDVEGVQACVCQPSPEVCNGRDDDCDARADEGTGAEVGCAIGELCTDGACSCAPANMCGGACVDIQADPLHCGSCGTVCPSGRCAAGACCESAVDLLFVVDNTNSIAEEQAGFADELPWLVSVLTTGDLNQDGDASDPGDFVPITDLHVGVVTTDMGVGGFVVPTCDQRDFGDDAVLRTQGNTALPSCAATYPSFLRYQGTDSSGFANDAACLVRAGTGGCGFPQPLEAALKALSPAAPTAWTAPGFTPPVFHGGTRGHADGANAGFLRPGSTLAIVVLSDSDDCSAEDVELFDPGSATYGSTDLNLRCSTHADTALHSIGRFVDGLLSLRQGPGRVVFVPIVGIPSDLASAPGEPSSYAALISDDLNVRDDRMEERIDPSMPNRLVPSCNTPGLGLAFPPVRLVRAAQGLEARGAGVSVQSICRDSMRAPFEALVRTLTDPSRSCN